MVSELGLNHAKPVGTPGTREDAAQTLKDNGEDNVEPDPHGWETPPQKCTADKVKDGEAETEGAYMNSKDATAYRGISARLNYLGQDRPDLATPPQKPVGAWQNRRKAIGICLGGFADTSLECHDFDKGLCGKQSRASYLRL